MHNLISQRNLFNIPGVKTGNSLKFISSLIVEKDYQRCKIDTSAPNVSHSLHVLCFSWGPVETQTAMGNVGKENRYHRQGLRRQELGQGLRRKVGPRWSHWV